jgi:ribose 5-phosphate isomerase A
MVEDNSRTGSRNGLSNVAAYVSWEGTVATIHDEGDAKALDESSIRAAATKALDQVFDGARVGLGSGHAVSIFIAMLGERRRQGLRVSAVAASERSAVRARKAGIPLIALEQELDMTVDGADEVAPNLDLVKGRGGALVRERIVAAASKRQIIVVSETKLVQELGEHVSVPVEVIPLARWLVTREIENLGLLPLLRTDRARRQPLVSDNGNITLDCGPSKPLADGAHARELERTLLGIPGVVDTGLFLGTADQVFVGREDGDVDILRRTESPPVRK